MKIHTVYIDQDYASLGPAATQSDLDRYAEKLAGHLASKFGCIVQVKQVLGGKRAGRSCITSDEIDEYVRELKTGEGWIELLEKDTDASSRASRASRAGE